MVMKITEDFLSCNPGKKRASIKPVFKFNGTSYDGLLENSKCLLTISVGQEVHESEKFFSTIQLVNRSFNSCIVLIDDSLQRHTMALDNKHDPDFFYEISLQAGDQWLQRNSKYLKELTILEDTIRWDKWLKHSDYSTQEAKIKRLMLDDVTYRDAFEKTVEIFLDRYYRRLIGKLDFDIDRARKICMGYLIEECTALTLWPETNCNFEVYPGQRNLCMDATHKRFVLPAHPNLLHAVSIKFKNRGQLGPQRLQYCL